MGMLREHWHTHAIFPVSDFLIYFVAGSQINPAINQPAPFRLGDKPKMLQAEDCPYVNYHKLASILPHLYWNKAIYVSEKA